MDFSRITNNKYVDYFTSVSEACIDEKIMNEFLNEMNEICKSLENDKVEVPIEIVTRIKERLGLEGSVYAVVTQIAGGDLINSLSSLEIFTLLWFVSCKNYILFEVGVYYNMAKNKVIGNLLKKLASF